MRFVGFGAAEAMARTNRVSGKNGQVTHMRSTYLDQNFQTCGLLGSKRQQ
jgi:hypothetical protein